MPFMGPFAAAFKAAFTESLLAGLSTKTVRSTTLTLGVGTRMAYPSSLPFSSGMTRCNALAAPVELGIMLRAAARARRKRSEEHTSELQSLTNLVCRLLLEKKKKKKTIKQMMTEEII